MDISVIIPIYNVEQYIERCLRSLFTQTKTDGVEFILVNDCTPDRSMEIAQQIIEEYSSLNVKIVNNEKNLGSGATRGIGIAEAKSLYTIQIDSDDWCEPTMLEELYNKALETRADVVIFDSLWHYGGEITKYEKEELPNDKLHLWYLYFIEDKLHTLWSKLVKRDLYSKQSEDFFFEGLNNSDDFVASCKLLHYAKKMSYIPKAYLHYNCANESSITFNRNGLNNVLQRRDALIKIEHFLIRERYGVSVIRLMNKIKMQVKYSLLLQTKGKLQKECAKLWPETNKEIFNSNYRFYHKLRMWFAVKGMLPISRIMLNLMRLVKKK